MLIAYQCTLYYRGSCTKRFYGDTVARVINMIDLDGTSAQFKTLALSHSRWNIWIVNNWFQMLKLSEIPIAMVFLMMLFSRYITRSPPCLGWATGGRPTWFIRKLATTASQTKMNKLVLQLNHILANVNRYSVSLLSQSNCTDAAICIIDCIWSGIQHGWL